MKPFLFSRHRRRGVALVWVGLFLITLVGLLAFSIDLSRLYVVRAEAQSAADAAALAGAYQHANGTGNLANSSAANTAARPENGGYVEGGARGARVILTYQPTVDNVVQGNWYRAKVSRSEPTFFAGIFGDAFRNVTVGAESTALFESFAELPISGNGYYGVAPGPVNLSLFGPEAWFNNGDRYSTKRLSNNPQTANPEYNGLIPGIPEDDIRNKDKGYNFSINLDQFRGKPGNNRAYLQIFDPDCFNANNAVNAAAGVSIDEMRKPDGSNGSSTDATTTKYRLWMDPDGPTIVNPNGTVTGSQPEAPVVGGTQSFGGTSTTDMLWNDVISADMSSIPVNAKLRLQVISTAGSSENGFDLRIDNKPAASSAMQIAERNRPENNKSAANRFDSNNGSVITAQGHLPINFNQNGTVNMALGYVPSTANGGIIKITNFDTDVTAGNQANAVTFTCNPPVAGQPFRGNLSGNGEWRETQITLPTNVPGGPINYAGGNWTATYSAGAQDTSVWDMSYNKPGGKPSGKIRLVK